uniref:glutathione transferase n=1 Tax=Meloidogyne incognita TaxID=6306 RepID=A0A914LE53_MELIC
MVQYKLHYFDLPGRAEAIRMLFYYKGQPFEDYRIKKEDWPTIKSNYIFGQVPVLEVDGKQLAQAGVILQFLGKKFDLGGKNELEEAKAMEIIFLNDEFGVAVGPYIGAKFGFREGNVEQLRKDVFLPAIERYFPLYEKRLEESNSGFILPSGLSFVDFSVAHFTGMMIEMEKDIMAKYPKLVDFSNRFYSLPQLKEYLSKKKC